MKIVSNFNHFVVTIGVVLAMSTIATAEPLSVQKVQEILIKLGYDPGPIDGSFGNKTELALINFYANRGEQYDGVLDNNEFEDLENESSVLSSRSVTLINPDSQLSTKLEARRTINPFMSWYTRDFARQDYSLFFTAQPPRSRRAITLAVMQWMYFFPNASWDYIDGIESFITSENWDHSAEYGETKTLSFADPEFPTFFASAVQNRINQTSADGVWLDFWFNAHPSSQYSRSEVSQARRHIISAIRNQIGADKIIMGNVAWNLDQKTIPFLNGVFLEFVKPENEQNIVYSQSELRLIERSISYYEENLSEPKIIAVNGWRATHVSDRNSRQEWDNDRNSKENRRMAKLITAMSVVIPTNGYIMYSDNNPDSDVSEHGHLFYDFFNFDIGQPIGPMIGIRDGAGLKEHENGFVAYNINNRSLRFTRVNGQVVEIARQSGLFCRELSGGTECLPID